MKEDELIRLFMKENRRDIADGQFSQHVMQQVSTHRAERGFAVLKIMLVIMTVVALVMHTDMATILHYLISFINQYNGDFSQVILYPFYLLTLIGIIAYVLTDQIKALIER